MNNLEEQIREFIEEHNDDGGSLAIISVGLKDDYSKVFDVSCIFYYLDGTIDKKCLVNREVFNNWLNIKNSITWID